MSEDGSKADAHSDHQQHGAAMSEDGSKADAQSDHQQHGAAMSELEERLRRAAQQLDAASARYQAAQPSPMTRRVDTGAASSVRSLKRPRWTTRSVITSGAAGLMVAAATLAVIVLARRQAAPVSEKVGSAPPISNPVPTTPTTPSTITADIKADEVAIGVSLNGLANGRYLIDPTDTEVTQFAGGRATRSDGSSYQLLLGEVGDIDNDGREDAAVTIMRSVDRRVTNSWLLFVELNSRGMAAINARADLTATPGTYATTDGKRIRLQLAPSPTCPGAEMQWWTVAGTLLKPTGESTCVATVTIADSLTTEEFRFAPGTDLGIATFSDLSGNTWFAASAGQQLHLTVRYNSASLPGQEVFVVADGQRLGSAVPGRPLDLNLPTTGRYELELPRIDASLGDRPLIAELSIR
jgi:hypothetical protein